MNNLYFEHKYLQNIQYLYGDVRNSYYDNTLLQNNSIPHKYSIFDRIDMTNMEVYSIDPIGCEDVDDAFSIYFEGEEMFLAIHIADPTEYINIESELWSNTVNTLITRYPSNRKPIHMMPKEIIEKSSLQENKYGNIKKTLTIIVKIDKDNYNPISKPELLFTEIKVKKENALDYLTASKIIDTTKCFEIGLKISNKLQKLRRKKTIGEKLNEVSKSIINYDKDGPYLYNNTLNEKLMKLMISEFAILSNTFIGKYLVENCYGYGLFRTCEASNFMENISDKNLTGDEILQEIITNGIKANYKSNKTKHDLVGSKEYTHFTSPIRRVSDCICHYLLKYVYLKNNNIIIDVPFDIDYLQYISEQCNIQFSQMKNIQYRDTKFRLLQIINRMLKDNIPVNISYYIKGYKSVFLNLTVNKINDFNVYLPYTVMVSDYYYNDNPKKIYTLNINQVNCLERFDTDTIPELDRQFII